MNLVVVAPGLWSTDSTVVVRGLSCPIACGIFPDQGWNPCLLHWQADSQPLTTKSQQAVSLCTFKHDLWLFGAIIYPLHWQIWLPSSENFCNPAYLNYIEFLCGHLAVYFSHFITFSVLFGNLSFLFMNQCPPLNVKLQEGRNHTWLVHHYTSSSWYSAWRVWTFSLLVKWNECSSECFHIHYLSGGKVEQCREDFNET